MIIFTKEQIKEISGQMDLGLSAFYHKKTGELIFVPDMERYYGMDTNDWQEDFDKLEKNILDYQQIMPMESSDSFKVMADFAEELKDINLRDKLLNALNRKKPFKEFNFVIDNSGNQRQKWFDFKNKRNIEWTEDQLKIQTDNDQ